MLPDHVVLRRKGDGLPIALPLTVLPGVEQLDSAPPAAGPRPPKGNSNSVEKSDKT